MKTQPYTDQELQQLNGAFWQSDGLWHFDKSQLPCPNCGANAQIVFIGATFGSPSEIHVICYSCKRSGATAAVEEEQGEFPEEKVAEYVERHQRGLDSYCHFCRTLVGVQEHPTFGSMDYFFLCPRCGADGQAEV